MLKGFGLGSHRSILKQFDHKNIKKLLISPPLPNNIGRKTKWKNINGVRRYFTIVDEIKHIQYNNQSKLIVLQKLISEEKKTIEFRLGYYMIGVKPRMAGKWIWGQFATIIPARDLIYIINAAHKRRRFQIFITSNHFKKE